MLETDGHDVGAILDTCYQALAVKGRPTIIISKTVKGKGVSYMEDDYNWHSKPMTQADFDRAMSDLAPPDGGT